MDPIEPWVDRDELRRLADALLAAPAEAAPPSDATYGAQFEGYEAPVKTPATAEAPPLSSVQAAAQAVEAPVAAAIEQQARQVLASARKIATRGGILANPAPPASAAAVAPPPEPGPEPVTAPIPAPQPIQESTLMSQAGPSEVPAPTPVPAPEPMPAHPEGERQDAPGSLPQVASPVPAPPSEQPPQATTPFVARLKAFGNWLRQGVRATSYFLTDRDGGVLIDEVQSPKLHQVARTLAQASRTANRQAGAAAIGNLHIKISSDSNLEVIPVNTLYGPLVLGIIVPKPIKPENVEIIARALQQVMEGRRSA